MCAIAGIGLPFASALSSCKERVGFKGKVIVVGAGPAGLTAAYHLHQRGIDVQVLEAASTFGGRTKTNTTFADFPIPLGAEWLHTDRTIFDNIVNDASTAVAVETTQYNPDVDYGLFEGQQITVAQVGFTDDAKFINSSWLDFFQTYVLPPIASRIEYNSAVESIDYSGDQVLVTTPDRQLSADKVIVTVPLKILQNGAISFSPALPTHKQEAIDEATVWDGFKAFIEFSESFYPAFTAFDISPETAGQKLYYDASYGQNTSQHILGLFTVGVGSHPYQQLSGTDQLNYMLTELDQIYNGQASAKYVRHTTQDWNAEPYINGAYLYDHENWRRVRVLGESVGDKVYFAGEAYTNGQNWGGVDAAATSAITAVEELVS